MIVNFPHNPTGAHLSKSDWHQLYTCCRKHDAYLFSDEMYRLLEHNASDLLPSAADSYERGISLSGMSKALSMPGLRIGWVATQDQELLQKVLQLKDYTTICSSAPSEVYCAPYAPLPYPNLNNRLQHYLSCTCCVVLSRQPATIQFRMFLLV